MMKFTLVVILYAMNYNYINTVSTSSSTNSSITVCSNNSATYSSNVPISNRTNTKIAISMPDLKACIEARKQFDSYENLVAATCDAKE